jgi:D-glycero-alpha-D-manno-heptose-7-phosphate kinase
MDHPMTVIRSAPLRLDFAGGWTDVAPFATEQGGVVVNGAISLRARATAAPADAYELVSDDLGRTLRPSSPADLEPNGDLDLLKVAITSSGVGPCRLHTRCDAPPGSGLGSSGAIGVALVAAVRALRGDASVPPGDLAEAAWQLETVEAALPGGKQDQYAAALGGFLRLDFRDGRVDMRRLPVDPATRDALAERLLVCYTGQSRVSSETIARVMDRFVRGDVNVTSALHALVEIGDRMADAVCGGDLPRIGRLLSMNWREQQRLDAGMRTDAMERLEAALETVGVFGGKAAGAGAGGSMFFLVSGSRADAARAARAAGATVLPATWSTTGLESC